ncbi:peptide-methionine (S)-S-oxide reductase MsrA [Lacticaseibacillus sp. GG6-2]
MPELATLYNLLLDPGTRAWEREQLQHAKAALEHHDRAAWSRLEAALRPLALRDNLTPAVADFYSALRQEAVPSYDFAKHTEAAAKYERAIFAGGCFWCLVQPFEDLPGIVSVLSGYTGGGLPHPTYDQVHSGTTGHVEAVEVVFDPALVSYDDLVALYWQLSDPTDALGQINDRGPMYRPVIFTTTAAQQTAAAASKSALAASHRFAKPIVTAIEAAKPFWPAENYHQQFYRKQPQRYARIHRARQQFLAAQRLRGWFSRKLQ